MSALHARHDDLEPLLTRDRADALQARIAGLRALAKARNLPAPFHRCPACRDSGWTARPCDCGSERCYVAVKCQRCGGPVRKPQ